MSYTLTQAEYRRLKTALTRAINSGDPHKIVKTCNQAEAIFASQGYPDSWSRWTKAKEDAQFAISRASSKGNAWF